MPQLAQHILYHSGQKGLSRWLRKQIWKFQLTARVFFAFKNSSYTNSRFPVVCTPHLYHLVASERNHWVRSNRYRSIFHQSTIEHDPHWPWHPSCWYWPPPVESSPCPSTLALWDRRWPQGIAIYTITVYFNCVRKYIYTTHLQRFHMSRKGRGWAVADEETNTSLTCKQAVHTISVVMHCLITV